MLEKCGIVSKSLKNIRLSEKKKKHVKLAKSWKRKDATEYWTSYKSISFSLIIFEMINLLWYQNDGLTKEFYVNFVGKKTQIDTMSRHNATSDNEPNVHQKPFITTVALRCLATSKSTRRCRLRALFQRSDTGLFGSAATSTVLTFSDMVQGLLQLANKWENIH